MEVWGGDMSFYVCVLEVGQIKKGFKWKMKVYNSDELKQKWKWG